jgi:adenine phosphoribosyltransferase
MKKFESLIRDVHDFPKKGIIFKDITTLLNDKAAFKKVINEMSKKYKNAGIDIVVGAEARGFIFAAAVAYAIGAGFVPVRKPGKLPYKTYKQEFTLEYGTDAFEIHTDAVLKGQKVLIVDDLLATGGTSAAIGKLIKKLKGDIVGFAFLIELDFLNGRKKIKNYDVLSLLHY